jgi:hypothetical protein
MWMPDDDNIFEPLLHDDDDVVGNDGDIPAHHDAGLCCSVQVRWMGPRPCAASQWECVHTQFGTCSFDCVTMMRLWAGGQIFALLPRCFEPPYPAGFFAATAAPAAVAAGSASVGSMTAASAITGNSIVITTAIVGIAASTAFTVTMSGLTMGAAALADSAIGITVQTDQDTSASAGAASGAMTSEPVNVTIAADDRIAAKASDAAVTHAFTTQTPLASGGNITLN